MLHRELDHRPISDDVASAWIGHLASDIGPLDFPPDHLGYLGPLDGFLLSKQLRFLALERQLVKGCSHTLVHLGHQDIPVRLLLHEAIRDLPLKLHHLTLLLLKHLIDAIHLRLVAISANSVVEVSIRELCSIHEVCNLRGHAPQEHIGPLRTNAKAIHD